MNMYTLTGESTSPLESVCDVLWTKMAKSDWCYSYATESQITIYNHKRMLFVPSPFSLFSFFFCQYLSQYPLTTQLLRSHACSFERTARSLQLTLLDDILPPRSLRFRTGHAGSEPSGYAVKFKTQSALKWAFCSAFHICCLFLVADNDLSLKLVS